MTTKRIPVQIITLAVDKQLTTNNPNYEVITDLIAKIEHEERLSMLKVKLSKLYDRLAEIDAELDY
mgnify:FL=1|jgi:hypothetical protein|nr:MAG TPA: hypothetical protein [Caudoviricetes sp.]